MNSLTIIEQFDGKPIEFQSGDAFVNLTSLCHAFGRRPGDFLALPSAQRYLSALAADLKALPENLVTVRQGGSAQAQGTWAHPDLGLECARWLSPDFSIWCNRTIRRILAGDPVAVAPTPALPQDYIGALEALLDSKKKEAALLLENAELKPKAEFFDAVTASSDTFGWNETAKLLDMGRNRMLKKLRGIGVLMTGKERHRHNTPYQRYIDEGYFSVTEGHWTDPKDGTTHLTLTTRVFQRGVDFIRRRLATP